MMIMETEINISEVLVSLLLIYSICFTGAVTKDMLDTLTGKCSAMQIKKDFLSAFTTTIIMYGLTDVIVSRIGFKPFLTISYIMGLISFEILMKISTLQGLKNLINEYRDFKNFRESNSRDNET